MGMTRRTFLAASVAALALPLVGCGEQKEDTDRLTSSMANLDSDVAAALNAGLVVDGKSCEFPDGSTFEVSHTATTDADAWVQVTFNAPSGTTADDILEATVRVCAGLAYLLSINVHTERVIVNGEIEGIHVSQVTYLTSSPANTVGATVARLLEQAESYSLENALYEKLSSFKSVPQNG